MPVAWIDVLGETLEVVHQRYERRSADAYWYESARFDYFERLGVNTAGFVERYPNLWEVVR